MSSTSSPAPGKSTERRERLAYLVLAALSPLFLLGVWVLATQQGWVRSVLLPSPAAVFSTLQEMVTQGYGGIGLATHIGASLMRVGTAFVAGSLLGITIGMLRGRVAPIDALWLVPSELLRPIPPLGLIPLFILWFGIGEMSKILLIFLSVFLIMMINAQAGARSCGQDALRAAQTLGANRIQIFRHVVLPSALPQIVTGLRVALGTALSILVASELLGGDRGLGFIVLDASNFFRTAHVFAGIAIIGAIGLISDRSLATLGRRWVHWEGKR
jgi:NitT/TauT family transport system permease protein/taurine transport system permease protein